MAQGVLDCSKLLKQLPRNKNTSATFCSFLLYVGLQANWYPIYNALWEELLNIYYMYMNQYKEYKYFIILYLFFYLDYFTKTIQII